jgi:hypothetical protein
MKPEKGFQSLQSQGGRMCKFQKGIIVLVLTLAVAGTAMAFDGDGFRPRECRDRHMGAETGGPMLLGRYVHQNICAKVLAEMTGKPVELLRTELDGRRVPFVLEKFGVDRQAFRTAMKKEMALQVRQAVKDGRITQPQADRILKKMAERRERRREHRRTAPEGESQG